MHTTDTVDFDVIVFGEVNLELDDGAEVLLKAGDYVIQNGTRYASHNRSSGKYVISVAIVGAERRSPSRGTLRRVLPERGSTVAACASLGQAAIAVELGNVGDWTRCFAHS